MSADTQYKGMPLHLQALCLPWKVSHLMPPDTDEVQSISGLGAQTPQPFQDGLRSSVATQHSVKALRQAVVDHTPRSGHCSNRGPSVSGTKGK
jgi:hypothetical protein